MSVHEELRRVRAAYKALTSGVVETPQPSAPAIPPVLRQPLPTPETVAVKTGGKIAALPPETPLPAPAVFTLGSPSDYKLLNTSTFANELKSSPTAQIDTAVRFPTGEHIATPLPAEDPVSELLDRLENKARLQPQPLGDTWD